MTASTDTQPAAGPEPDQRTFQLRVDAHDLIVHVNGNWLSFGRENNYPVGRFSGQPLFKFITDSTTQQIYHSLINRARQHRKTMKVPFRCDSPVLRRFMEMEVVPLPGMRLNSDPASFAQKSDVLFCSWIQRRRAVRNSSGCVAGARKSPYPSGWRSKKASSG